MGGHALILLDTHVLVWLDQGLPDLGAGARETIDDAFRSDQLCVSAISFWEIAMLVSKHRLIMQPSIVAWRNELLTNGLNEIPLSGEAAIGAVELPDMHADPADRFITATALSLGASLITADERLLRWPGSLKRVDARN